MVKFGAIYFCAILIFCKNALERLERSCVNRNDFWRCEFLTEKLRPLVSDNQSRLWRLFALGDECWRKNDSASMNRLSIVLDNEFYRISTALFGEIEF